MAEQFNPSTVYWRGSGGRTIAVSGMDDNYLMNTIRYIEKKAAEKEPSDDEAAYKWIHIRYPLVYPTMIKEAHKRGLLQDLDGIFLADVPPINLDDIF